MIRAYCYYRFLPFRAFAEMHNTDDSDYETVANALMPAGESRIWNNAIMELGGVACGKKQPESFWIR